MGSDLPKIAHRPQRMTGATHNASANPHERKIKAEGDQWGIVFHGVLSAGSHDNLKFVRIIVD